MRDPFLAFLLSVGVAFFTGIQAVPVDQSHPAISSPGPTNVTSRPTPYGCNNTTRTVTATAVIVPAPHVPHGPCVDLRTVTTTITLGEKSSSQCVESKTETTTVTSVSAITDTVPSATPGSGKKDHNPHPEGYTTTVIESVTSVTRKHTSVSSSPVAVSTYVSTGIESGVLHTKTFYATNYGYKTFTSTSTEVSASLYIYSDPPASHGTGTPLMISANASTSNPAKAGSDLSKRYYVPSSMAKEPSFTGMPLPFTTYARNYHLNEARSKMTSMTESPWPSDAPKYMDSWPGCKHMSSWASDHKSWSSMGKEGKAWSSWWKTASDCKPCGTKSCSWSDMPMTMIDGYPMPTKSSHHDHSKRKEKSDDWNAYESGRDMISDADRKKHDHGSAWASDATGMVSGYGDFNMAHSTTCTDSESTMASQTPNSNIKREADPHRHGSKWPHTASWARSHFYPIESPKPSMKRDAQWDPEYFDFYPDEHHHHKKPHKSHKSAETASDSTSTDTTPKSTLEASPVLASSTTMASATGGASGSGNSTVLARRRF